MTMMGGDGDADDAAAMAAWSDLAASTWRLPAWSKSPAQMQDECRAANQSYRDMLAGPAKKHDNPPLPPNRARLL